jgi:orotidine-5'-phosphate decarboxylase
MAARLKGLGLGIKLGLEFFVAEGPQGVVKLRAVIGEETPLFLDLKLHDIPNTVAGAIRAAVRCRPGFITIHASGGAEMMRAAEKAAKEAAAAQNIPAPKLLGVTVLTSIDAAALEALGQGSDPAGQVRRLALLAAASGLQGIVCAPTEIGMLRQALPPGLQIVVPGVRPEGADKGDQKRTMTPAEAAALGADWLVVGRPITQAADPAQAARDILQSIRKRAA